MIIPELVTSLQKNTRLRKSGAWCSGAWCIGLLILRLRSKPTPENYFQATSRKPDMSMSRFIAVLSVWVVSAVVLLSVPRVVKVLGHRGLMGMILVMLSVQMLLDGSSN